jgi:hypothetical protein
MDLLLVEIRQHPSRVSSTHVHEDTRVGSCFLPSVRHAGYYEVSFTIRHRMASARFSTGLDHPAARSAVRDLGCTSPTGRARPGSEVGGSIQVPINDQAAAAADKDPLTEAEVLVVPAAARTGLARRKPAVSDQQLPAPPALFVGHLAAQFGPASVSNRTRQVAVEHHASHVQVFHDQPIVGLDQLGGDLVQIVAPLVGDVGVVAAQPPDDLGPIGRAKLLSGDGAGHTSQTVQASLQALWRRPPADLDPVGRSRHRQGAQASIDPYPAVMIVRRPGSMSEGRVQVRRFHRDTDLPSDAATANSCEEYPRSRLQHRLASFRVRLSSGDRPQEATQPASVLDDADDPDFGQPHRASLSFADPDAAGSMRTGSVANPEALPGATLLPPFWEADSRTFPHAASRLPEGCQSSAEINGGLLEHLRHHLLPPPQPCHLQISHTFRADHEAPASGFAPLPGVECVYQGVGRPRHLDLRVDMLAVRRLTDQRQALVVGVPGRTRVTSEGLSLLRSGIEGVPEGGVSHGGWSLRRRGDTRPMISTTALRCKPAER